MIKVLKKLGTEGIYLKIIKTTSDKLTAKIVLNVRKQVTFPLKSGTR
jgi:hypothetical protein